MSSAELSSITFPTILGSLIVLGMAVGTSLGAAMDADKVRSALEVAETDHEAKATGIYKEWTKTLVELGNKAQALVDECKSLLS